MSIVNLLTGNDSNIRICGRELTSRFIGRGFIVFCAWAAIACTKKPPQEINLAIWANYLDPKLTQSFTEKTGVKVNISNYSSNEELLAKIQAGQTGIDVAVPSDYMVSIMKTQNLLLKLDKSLLPLSREIDPRYLKLEFDSDNSYSLPYIWTTSGIAYNSELISEMFGEMTSSKGKTPPHSWRDFLENSAYKGKVSVLDDVREVAGLALKTLGFSLNSKNQNDIDQALKLLTSAKDQIKLFSSDTIDLLLNKEIAMAQSYSSDALQAELKSGGKIKYLIPDEGSSFAIDNLVILKNAPHAQAAHLFINAMYSPEADISRVTMIRGGPVLKTTRNSLPVELRNHPGLFPDEKVLSRLEKIKDLGDYAQAYDKLWSKVKSN